jgi:hypothetical protein
MHVRAGGRCGTHRRCIRVDDRIELLQAEYRAPCGACRSERCSKGVSRDVALERASVPQPLRESLGHTAASNRPHQRSGRRRKRQQRRRAAGCSSWLEVHSPCRRVAMSVEELLQHRLVRSRAP